MAKTSKSLSRANKRRLLLAQQKRLEAQLAKVSQKLEQCMVCNTDTLRRELANIESSAETQRQQMYRRLGLTPAQASELMSSRSATSKKKASKKKTGKKIAKASSSKKVGKKRSKSRGKKRAKKG